MRTGVVVSLLALAVIGIGVSKFVEAVNDMDTAPDNIRALAPWVYASRKESDIDAIGRTFDQHPSIRLVSGYRCTVAACGFDSRYVLFIKERSTRQWEADGGDFATIREVLEKTDARGMKLTEPSISMTPYRNADAFFAVQVRASSNVSAKSVADRLSDEMNGRRQASK